MKKNGLRKIINNLHLWMGLSSGIVIFIVCLSGTVYTFRSEIERWIEPGKYYAEGTITTGQLPADSLIAIIEKQNAGKVTSIMVPGDVSMNWQVTVKSKNADSLKTEKTANKRARTQGGARPKTYFVNPYTGKIAGEQGGATNDFFTKLMQLHRWLLVGEGVGRTIVGTATVIFVFMILTGLVLWFPARIKNWRRGFTIKTSANWKRLNHDLHNTLGFYSFFILLIMSLTGLCWSFEWYRQGISSVLGAKVFKGKGEKPMLSDRKMEFRRGAGAGILLSETDRLFRYQGNSRLTIPEDSNAAIIVTKSATGFFAVAGADKVYFDRFSGEPLKVESFSAKPLNVQIADSIRHIHTGEIFGIFSKIIYFLVCLIASSLPVTGTMIWLNKMKKKKNAAKLPDVKVEEFA